MRKALKRHKPATGVASNAVRVTRIATGEIDEPGLTADGKNAAAVALGRKGGIARARAVKKSDRVKIAKLAAAARWKSS
jgi:hypothetical protein